jgi:hypothetical protein
VKGRNPTTIIFIGKGERKLVGEMHALGDDDHAFIWGIFCIFHLMEGIYFSYTRLYTMEGVVGHPYFMSMLQYPKLEWRSD